MAHIKQKCDFCNSGAIYDAKTIFGPWANLCQMHFEQYATKEPGLFSRLEEVLITHKKCALCGQDKPIEQFYKYVDKRGVTRFRNECKECNLTERKRQRMRGVKRE